MSNQQSMNGEVRQLLKVWQARNRWEWIHISNAMRVWGLSNIPGAARIEAFSVSGSTSLHPEALHNLKRFIVTYPEPGRYEDLVDQLESEREARRDATRGRFTDASLRREQERAAHIRYWLDQELPANGAPARKPEPRIFLDKATVAALSGMSI